MKGLLLPILISQIPLWAIVYFELKLIRREIRRDLKTLLSRKTHIKL